MIIGFWVASLRNKVDEIWNWLLSVPQSFPPDSTFLLCSLLSSKIFIFVTGNSMSEALIFASIHPRYERLFIEFP